MILLIIKTLYLDLEMTQRSLFMIEIKNGKLDDFFESAMQTALNTLHLKEHSLMVSKEYDAAKQLFQELID